MSRLPEFAADFHLLWLISTGGLGGIIGSFLNVVIHRLLSLSPSRSLT